MSLQKPSRLEKIWLASKALVLQQAQITQAPPQIILSGDASGAGTDTLHVTGNMAASAAKWTTPRNLAGNSVDGSANVAFANKFIIQGTADTGLSSAQFLGALATGIVKNTTTTGALTIAVAGDFPTLNQNTSGNASTVTTNANLTGPITSVGNATSIASQTGTGTKFVVDTGPTISTLTATGTTVLGTAGTNNVGVGITPSAWSLGNVVEVGQLGNAVFGASVNNLQLYSNTYYNGGLKFAGTGYANIIQVGSGNGTYVFLTSSASGTAGNTPTMNTVLALGAAGNITNLAGITASGALGVPIVVASGRFTVQTAANASVSTFTVGAADASFEVSANVNVTAVTVCSFTVTCTYTDETNVSRTLTMGFTQLTGATLLSTITQVTGAGPYESVVYHLRCKASTAITIATTGTFTTVTYNVEGIIKQTA